MSRKFIYILSAIVFMTITYSENACYAWCQCNCYGIPNWGGYTFPDESLTGYGCSWRCWRINAAQYCCGNKCPAGVANSPLKRDVDKNFPPKELQEKIDINALPKALQKNVKENELKKSK